MLLFVKAILLDKTPVYACKINNVSIQKYSDISLEPANIISKESSEQVPKSQLKKRNKGISLEFEYEVAEKESDKSISSQEKLLIYFPFISSCQYYWNGKRGPPSAMSTI